MQKYLFLYKFYKNRGYRMTLSGKMKKPFFLALLVVSLAATVAIISLKLSDAGAAPLPVSPLLLGTNLALHSAQDPMLTSSATQKLVQQIGAGTIRIPTPRGLADATLIKAAQTVKSLGARPVVILHGDIVDRKALAYDKRVIQIMDTVFGKKTIIYYEYGNEQDLFGPATAQQYTASWNRIIPALKQLAPDDHFIGPVNYQYNGKYLKYFLQNARPRPNEVSWHEYTCGDDNSWTKATCIQRIDNWTKHFNDARAVMAATLRTQLPIIISEWNYTPNPLAKGGKYTDNAFMTTWTNKALQNLAANKIFAAMQYTCINHPLALINSKNALTAQGKAFLAQPRQR
jgi:hypothetical protein